MKKCFLFATLLFVISGCASRPKLYPNGTYKAKGEKIAESDIDKCMDDSEVYLKSGKGKQIAKSGGFGAVVGGAMGAVGGIFTGNPMRGAAEGAAIGGAGGAAAGAMTPDQLKHQYVNQCLAEKGYQVLGWD
jgi:outer membrane lipoprotein SlyB